jgi:hypothetical protein
MQRQMIAVLAISCVLISAGYAQAPSSGATPVPPIHGPEKQAALEASKGNSGATAANPNAVGMDQPVITLKGACDPKGDTTPAKDCVSVVTREQFEKLTKALQPDMPAESKRQLATNYGRLLMFADAARALHVENDPNVQQIMQFVTDQVLAEGLKRHYADQYSHPSDQQIQDYYNHNSSKYLEATLQRIIIPHSPGTGDNPKATEAEEAAAAEKLRQRWIAGEDPAKLQQAAFDAAGIKGASIPDINMGAKRPGSLPVNQEPVFQLKAGEVSQVYSEPAAAYLYKVVSSRQIPLSEEKDSIVKTLQQQQLQDKLDEVGKSATAVLNEEYFGPPPAAAPAPAGARPTPGAAPQTGNPPK